MDSARLYDVGCDAAPVVLHAVFSLRRVLSRFPSGADLGKAKRYVPAAKQVTGSRAHRKDFPHQREASAASGTLSEG